MGLKRISLLVGPGKSRHVFQSMVGLAWLSIFLAACQVTPAIIPPTATSQAVALAVSGDPAEATATPQPVPQATSQPVMATPVELVVSHPSTGSPFPAQDVALVGEIPTPIVTQAAPLPTHTQLAPGNWKTLPIVPTLSEQARQIFLQGQALGRDPHTFSKAGDCQNITTYFLANFEDPSLYRLGEYADLQGTIDWYRGSFGRESLAVRGGLNVAAVLSPLRADPTACEKGESPLVCELRLNNPSIVLISMEEAWTGEADKYGKYLRQVIDATLALGILPVLSTKADTLEGDHSINEIIAQLAWEYDLPLWNFWAAVQPLKYQGLTADGFHLSHGSNFFFDVSLGRQTGWTQRNLTALQTLDSLRRGLFGP